MSSGSCSNDTTFVSILLLFFSEFILSIEGHWREGLWICDFFLQKKSCERLPLPTTNVFLVESTILFALLLRLVATHCASLQLIAKWAKSFYWKTVLRRYWTPRSRMVRSHKHQRLRKMTFWGIIPLKRKKSRKWLINSRDFLSILCDFQPIFVGISVCSWALEYKNYFPMQKLLKSL